MLRKIVQGLTLTGVVLGAGALGAGCLDRPVTNQAPTIKTNFTSAVSQSGINKVDILFDIDNSASMGDKQDYLVGAIPQMIARLVTPRCLDTNGKPIAGENASPTTGLCTTGTPEFSAVHDMHIGVVTSALGSRLGIASGSGSQTTLVCDPATTVKSVPTTGPTVMVSSYNDDQGHLINRTGPVGTGPALTNAALTDASGGFLYWYPALGNGNTPAVTPPAGHYTTIGAGTDPAGASLVGDFTELVSGVGESGCGIESQLESWYRFLIQPDPYAMLTIVNGAATWSGVDTTILQQRHDFLRPDSLVAIIVLTDENDSEVDVRSYSGTGYNFMSQTYPPPRGTSACAMNPGDGTCQPCAAGSTDSACKINGGVYTSPTSSSVSDDWGSNLNLRHVHMGQKYGLTSVQFPLTRYYNGLTSPTVPNREGEYPPATATQPAAGSYTGTNNCVNPLFAGTLPVQGDVTDASAVTPTEINTSLCKLTGTATRTAGDVFYAHIGGVPHQLLQVDAAACTAAGCTGAASDPASCATNCAQKDALAPSDWQLILGASGASYVPGADGNFPAVGYDYTGIDPHMIESQSPRNQLPTADEPVPASMPSVSTLSGPTFTTNPSPDPINGREWTTNKGFHSLAVDREYACTFQLPSKSQRDCATLDPTSLQYNSCDCVPLPPTAPANSSDEVPPLCAKTSTDGTITSSVGDYTVQTHAKAYPTIRELTLANMMGTQGIVSSLCPIHTDDNAAGDDPLYGYRPAVNAIVNRLKGKLGAQCVPKLTPQASDGGLTIPCLVLVSIPTTSSSAPKSATDCASVGGGNTYTNVDPTLLANFKMEQSAMAGDASTSNNLGGPDYITCSLNQVSVEANASCVGSKGAQGWCYVTGSAIGGGSTCTQEIAYSNASIIPNGAVINLQCISENSQPDAGKSDAK